MYLFLCVWLCDQLRNELEADVHGGHARHHDRK